MAGFNDTTLGSQRIGFMQGGLKMECCLIGVSNDISASNEMPSTLTNLEGWVGHGCFSSGCVSANRSKAISNMSLCEGPVLEISIGDVTAGIVTANGKLTYIVWGW